MIPNYENFIKAIGALDESLNDNNPTYTIDNVCTIIKNELNRAIPDFKCLKVECTVNHDKQFFGIFIEPFITGDDFGKYLLGHLTDMCPNESFENFKPDAYKIDIDGRLIRDFNFSYHEIAAIILQEICAMNSIEPGRRVKGAIDNYIASTNSKICTESLSRTFRLSELVLKVSLFNTASLFRRFDFSLMDNMCDVVRDGLYEPFKTAYGKLVSGAKLEDINTNFLLLNWYFNSYKDISPREIDYMLRKAMEIESSKLFRQMLYVAYTQMVDRMRYDTKFYGQLVQEGAKHKGLIYQMKRNGLKSIEEDVFEYNMRLRNVETQDDAILLMRQINSRMSILEEYLEGEDMDEKDRARWEACYKKYLDLREALSKKTVYNKKMYGLFVDYNALQQMADNGNFMNTYY